MMYDAFYIIALIFYCILSLVFSLYIPGSVFIQKIRIQQGVLQNIFFKLGVGFVLWAVQGVVFGYLGIRWFTYIYLSTCSLIYLQKGEYKNVHWRLLFAKSSFTFFHCVAFFIFLFGMYGQVNRFVPSGIEFKEGIYMLTGASDDAFWHASLTNQLVRRFPPHEPGLSGVPVRNYHYWSNLFIAEFVRVYRLPIMATQFIFAPLLFSFLLGGISYTLLREIGIRRWVALLGVYLQFFASDVIYIISFITRRVWEFTVHPLEDGTMMFENPPRAASFIVTLVGLILLLKWLRKPSLLLGILTFLSFGIVIGFKVHTGLMVLGGIGGVFIYLLWRRRYRELYVPLCALIVSACVYLPVNSGAGLPIYAPLEMPRMFAAQEKIGIVFLELRRQIYYAHHNILRIIQTDVTMLALFMLGQFGIRNIGWFGLLQYRTFSSKGLYFFLLFGLIASMAIGSLVIQPVAGADIFNMYLASSFILWILALIVVNTWKIKNPAVIFLGIVLLVGLTLPRWWYKSALDIQGLIRSKPVIGREELDAFAFIKKHTHPKDVVAVSNYGQWDSMYPYISIFTDRDMYLSGQTILERHGVDKSARQKILDTLVQLKNPDDVYTQLVAHNIDIMILYHTSSWLFEKDIPNVIPIYTSESIRIYQVKKT